MCLKSRLRKPILTVQTMSETNDNSIALLRQIREGNQTAFKGLFDTYFTPLCRFIYYQTNDREASEELTLDIFTYLWDNRATFEIKLSVKAYLFQAARNRAINWLRQQKATVSIDAIDHSDLATDVSALETEELYQLIRAAVLNLPDRCREVFTLSRNENLTNKEIAHQLGISVKTVEAQITLALKRIRKFLGDRYSYLW